MGEDLSSRPSELNLKLQNAGLILPTSGSGLQLAEFILPLTPLEPALNILRFCPTKTELLQACLAQLPRLVAQDIADTNCRQSGQLTFADTDFSEPTVRFDVHNLTRSEAASANLSMFPLTVNLLLLAYQSRDPHFLNHSVMELERLTAQGDHRLSTIEGFQRLPHLRLWDSTNLPDRTFCQEIECQEHAVRSHPLDRRVAKRKGGGLVVNALKAEGVLELLKEGYKIISAHTMSDQLMGYVCFGPKANSKEVPEVNTGKHAVLDMILVKEEYQSTGLQPLLSAAFCIDLLITSDAQKVITLIYNTNQPSLFAHLTRFPWIPLKTMNREVPPDITPPPGLSNYLSKTAQLTALELNLTPDSLCKFGVYQGEGLARALEDLSLFVPGGVSLAERLTISWNKRNLRLRQLISPEAAQGESELERGHRLKEIERIRQENWRLAINVALNHPVNLSEIYATLSTGDPNAVERLLKNSPELAEIMCSAVFVPRKF